MRVLVCGGRNYQDRDRVFSELDWLDQEYDFYVVVHGACRDRNGNLRGADRWAEEWAKARERTYWGHPAEWETWGREAGPRRNFSMLRHTNPDLVIAFPGGKGTADMIAQARITGVDVIEIEEEKEEAAGQ